MFILISNQTPLGHESLPNLPCASKSILWLSRTNHTCSCYSVYKHHRYASTIRLLSLTGYCKISSIVPCAIQQVSSIVRIGLCTELHTTAWPGSSRVPRTYLALKICWINGFTEISGEVCVKHFVIIFPRSWKEFQKSFVLTHRVP